LVTNFENTLLNKTFFAIAEIFYPQSLNACYEFLLHNTLNQPPANKEKIGATNFEICIEIILN